VDAAAQALVAPPADVATALAAALGDDLPYMKRDGGFVRSGHDAALDETRGLRDESRRVVAALQARYADETGVRALKVRHNNVLGYFIEVTAQARREAHRGAAQRDLHPSPDACRPGALHHHRARGARDQDRECRRSRARPGAGNLRAASQPGDGCRRADQAGRAGACQPRCCVRAGNACGRARLCAPDVDRSLDFTIEGGRHPVVEQALQKDGGPFVANDCDLSPPSGANAGRIYVVTVPTWLASRPSCARTR